MRKCIASVQHEDYLLQTTFDSSANARPGNTEIPKDAVIESRKLAHGALVCQKLSNFLTDFHLHVPSLFGA